MGLSLFAEDLAIGLLVFLGVDVENDVHVGLGVGVKPDPHRVDGNAGGFFLREPERTGGDAAEGDRFAMPLRRHRDWRADAASWTPSCCKEGSS